MQIIQYPHPTLRHVSKPLKRIDAELGEIVQEMFRLMYEAKGVGLAANQVDLPYRLFIANTEAEPGKGEERVFINPLLSSRKGLAEAEEGCLSLPGLYADVKRPEKITIDAYDLQGQAVHLELDGLFARIVQHEVDHLDGKLFIDRLGTTGEIKLRDAIASMEAQFESRRARGEILSDEQIATRLAELEKLRT